MEFWTQTTCQSLVSQLTMALMVLWNTSIQSTSATIQIMRADTGLKHNLVFALGICSFYAKRFKSSCLLITTMLLLTRISRNITMKPLTLRCSRSLALIVKTNLWSRNLLKQCKWLEVISQIRLEFYQTSKNQVKIQVKFRRISQDWLHLKKHGSRKLSLDSTTIKRWPWSLKSSHKCLRCMDLILMRFALKLRKVKWK